jgi:hypothetical protein
MRAVCTPITLPHTVLEKAIGQVPDIEFSDLRLFSIPRGRFLYSFKLVRGGGNVEHISPLGKALGDTWDAKS